MKTKKEKKEANKFDLERFEIAKLKNMNLIKGGSGGDPNINDPIDTNHNKNGSSIDCDR
jgi:hypothetical protein